MDDNMTENEINDMEVVLIEATKLQRRSEDLLLAAETTLDVVDGFMKEENE